MSEHAKEPWYAAEHETNPDVMVITTADRDNHKPFPKAPIAEIDFWYDDPFGAEQKACAERIVAAVNACAGIPDSALKEGIFEDLIIKVRQLFDYPGDKDSWKDVERLLETLKLDG